MQDPDDAFLLPNGGAYETRETRTGPPLSYVAEKLANSILSIHEDLVSKEPEVRSIALSAALAYGATAFLALHNMLGLTHAPDWFERIEAMNRRNFRRWVERVASSGAVAG